MDQDLILSVFEQEPCDVATYSPLTLAFIGDAVYEQIIRTLIISKGNMPPAKLQQHTSHIVKAASQAAVLDAIMELLSEDEADVVRRGRNAKSHTVPKNAKVIDYRNATALEALCGYLYLTDNTKRLLELIKVGLDKANFKI